MFFTIDTQNINFIGIKRIDTTIKIIFNFYNKSNKEIKFKSEFFSNNKKINELKIILEKYGYKVYVAS